MIHAVDILYKVFSDISNMRDSVSSAYPNTEKRVENMTHSGVFLATFEVIEYPMKQYLQLSKFMLIKTGYLNLLCGWDFLCFNLMNYEMSFRSNINLAQEWCHHLD